MSFVPKLIDLLDSFESDKFQLRYLEIFEDHVKLRFAILDNSLLLSAIFEIIIDPLKIWGYLRGNHSDSHESKSVGDFGTTVVRRTAGVTNGQFSAKLL